MDSCVNFADHCSELYMPRDSETTIVTWNVPAPNAYLNQFCRPLYGLQSDNCEVSKGCTRGANVLDMNVLYVQQLADTRARIGDRRIALPTQLHPAVRRNVAAYKD